MVAKKKLPLKVEKHVEMRRADGWQNVLTGLGVAGKDKRMSARPAPRQFQRQECDDLYRADDICRKVVHKLPAEAFREGYQFQTEDDSSEAQVAWLEKWIKNLKLNYLMQKAWWMARLYGGAGLVLGIEDGQKMSEPVDLSNIRSISWANVFDRWQLTYQDVQRDITLPDYGQPQRFKLTTIHGVGFADGSNTVHRSRIIFFEGHELTDYEFIRNAYWHASILESIYQPLANFNAAHDGSASLIGDFAQSVYKLKNLTDMLSADRDDLIVKRMSYLDRARSIVNAVLLEEGEDFDRKTTNVSGLSELVDRAGQRLVAATEMPHNLVMGDGAKGGLGSEGQTEARDWYDAVATAQETYFRPKLERVLQFLNLCKSNPNGGIIDPKIRAVFKPLWQEPESAVVAMRLQQAQADQVYLSTGVLDPEEVAQSRFGGTEYSIETNLMSDRSALNSPELDPNLPERVTKSSDLQGAPDTSNASAEKPTQALLNGAQIQSVLELLNAVSSGNIPRESAVNTMVGGLGLSPSQAESMMGEIGRSFVSAEIKALEDQPQEQPKLDGFYESIDFTLPIEVRDTLAAGLQMVTRFFPQFSTAPLVNQARDLINGVSMSPLRVMEWCEFFSRKPAPDAATRDSTPTMALVTWNLHGAEWGSTWCLGLRQQMVKLENAAHGSI